MLVRSSAEASAPIKRGRAKWSARSVSHSFFAEYHLTHKKTEATYGLHYTQYDSISPVFTKYNQDFKNKLAKLYSITYKRELTKHGMTKEWGKQYHYHCTGHCKCVKRRVKTNLTSRAKSETWCDRTDCPIQGILNHGFLMSFEQHGYVYINSFFLDGQHIKGAVVSRA